MNVFYIHFTAEHGAEHTAKYCAETDEAAMELFREDFGNLPVDYLTKVLGLEDDEEEYEDEYEYDGQPDEAQEWHDFDPDC
jgi:hypothetical protein